MDRDIKKSELLVPADAIKIFDKALRAGEDALDACTPTPMIVEQHENMADDHSPVSRAYHVPDGVCGFAWINIKLKNTVTRQFINALKKADLASANGATPFRKDSYYGGYTYWVHQGNQSMQKKEAFACAFEGILLRQGIMAWRGSRID